MEVSKAWCISPSRCLRISANRIRMGSENAAPFQRVDKLFQVDAAGWFLGGMDKQIAVLADGEIAFAPTGDIIEFSGVVGGPTIGGLANLGAATAATFILSGDAPWRAANTRQARLPSQLKHGSPRMDSDIPSNTIFAKPRSRIHRRSENFRWNLGVENDHLKAGIHASKARVPLPL